jgi:predicted metal-binding membrane protein
MPPDVEPVAEHVSCIPAQNYSSVTENRTVGVSLDPNQKEVTTMETPPIIAPPEWEAARRQPLVKEKALTRAGTATTAAALTVTLGLAAACWVVAAWQMNGMDMGVATRLGSFGFFIAAWAAMMAAMMLPGAAPAVVRRAQAGGGVLAVPVFVGSYLAVWALAGVVVYALDRPHGTVAAGAAVIAAGAYELTPLKRVFRRRCRDSARSGFEFGLCCAGSSVGLMLILVALGVMSLTWMVVITILVLAQKLLRARAAVDVPLALALVGLGIWIVLAPSSVPGLTPPM